jgi:hypothetical protein
MEIRDLFPPVVYVAANGANPEIPAAAAEVGPVPISFQNYRIPAAAYQLLSVNSLIVTLGLVLDLYGQVNFPARCSLLPVGTDVLPAIITLPAAHAFLLFMMSEEGIRWLDSLPLYNPLFAGVHQNNIPIYFLPSICSICSNSWCCRFFCSNYWDCEDRRTEPRLPTWNSITFNCC